ncbi:MAG: hypothetical protein K9J13_02845 [Saprospiraceae bacterium]|nr:hypothetical protein [Saprospiraceae bacterium]
MKKLHFMAITLLTYSLSSCGPTSEDALEYYEGIVSYQKEIIEMEEKLQNEILKFVEISNDTSEVDSVDQIYYDELDSSFNSFINQINISISDINLIPDFVSDSTLKSASLDFLKTYKSAAENEYAKCISLIKIPADEFQDEHNEKFNDIFSKQINSKLDIAIEKFGIAQQNFADKYGFEIVD